MGEGLSKNWLLLFCIMFLMFCSITGMSGDLRLAAFFQEMDEASGASDVEMETEDEFKQYLEKKRGAATVDPDPESSNVCNSTYMSIKRFNLMKLEVPSLHGGTSVTSADNGSFHGGKNSKCGPAERYIYSKKRNLSFNFENLVEGLEAYAMALVDQLNRVGRVFRGGAGWGPWGAGHGGRV
jgi:hypothetical protein